MPDHYYLVITGPRWKWFKWPRKRNIYHKYCDYDRAKQFVEEMQKMFPEFSIRLGVKRGESIYLLHT